MLTHDLLTESSAAISATFMRCISKLLVIELDYRVLCVSVLVDTGGGTRGTGISGTGLASLGAGFEEHPQWSRKRLSRELCQRWQ